MRVIFILLLLLGGCSGASSAPESPKSDFVPFEAKAACWVDDMWPEWEDTRWCDPNKIMI